MKRKAFIIFFLYVVTFVPNIYSAWRDTGFIQWSQPNGITFTARLYGDEFENWMVTQGNYQIVKGSDDWFYYAVLGANGDYTPSTVRVGIDAPLQTSLNLQRSQARRTEIQNERLAFNQTLITNLPSSTDLDLAIVLVDFTPSITFHK